MAIDLYTVVKLTWRLTANMGLEQHQHQLDINPIQLSNDLYKALNASYKIDYDAFMFIMCEQPEGYQRLKDRGLAFNWGSNNLTSFLLMKSDFVKWYLWDISDIQRANYFTYISEHFFELTA